MRILAIDSSGPVASVALLEDERILAEYSVNDQKTHSQTLVPMLDEIRKRLALDLSTIDAIAIAKGPGSFTGLRIGSATAKGIGLALDKPLIPVETVNALAMNAWGYPGIVAPIMDARRDQVYTGIFRFTEGELVTIEEQCAVALIELTEKLNAIGENVLFLGDGVPVYREKLKELMRVPYAFAPLHASRQRAAALGVLAKRYYEAGKTESAAAHRPDYFRLSQAERERMERSQR